MARKKKLMSAKLRMEQPHHLPPDAPFQGVVSDTGGGLSAYGKKPKGQMLKTKGGVNYHRTGVNLQSGSHAMARHGSRALLEHPYHPDERVRNRSLRLQGRGLDENNLQVKLVVKVPEDLRHLFLLNSSPDDKETMSKYGHISFYYQAATHGDQNHRIFELNNGKVRKSKGYRTKLEALIAYWKGQLIWTKPQNT